VIASESTIVRNTIDINMKLLVIFVLFFAYVQATSDPYALVKVFNAVIPECVKEHNLDLNKVQETLSHNVLPEDDPKFTEFFICYHIKAGLFKPNGEGDKEKLVKELPQLIRWKFGETVDAQKFAKEAGEHCKDTPEGNSDAITTMRLRGCVLNYVQDHKN